MESSRQKSVKCEMDLQTDELELACFGAGLDFRRSHLRVDFSFTITRTCSKNRDPFGVFSFSMAVRDSPRSVFPGWDLCILSPFKPRQRPAHSIISPDAEKLAGHGDSERVAIRMAGENS